MVAHLEQYQGDESKYEQSTLDEFGDDIETLSVESDPGKPNWIDDLSSDEEIGLSLHKKKLKKRNEIEATTIT